MNKDQLDGGPAFSGIAGAQGYGASTRGPEGEWIDHNQGMSLRDWLTGLAMQALISRTLGPNSSGNTSPNWATTQPPYSDDVAKRAFQYATETIAILRKNS
jgi:hypothetical protein